MADRPTIKIPTVVTVRELAGALEKPVTELMSLLLKEGVLVTLNDNLDFETAAVIASDLGFEVARQEVPETIQAAGETAGGFERRRRAPVVTVLGHVDHGKTSLLDFIRQTKVAAGEAGGITQSIGAYQVPVQGRLITFIDTPGHEAFSAMRAQGAKVTDVAVLVVAADEGVKPQTIESINLIKAANVPLVVAITKIDKAGANLEKVKRELAEHKLIAEEWGGQVVIVPVSSKTGQGVDELLEMILLSADLLDLTVPFGGPASAVVIETHRDPKAGVVATVIVEKGILNTGDPFVAGQTYGKIRYLENHRALRVKEAVPGMPVRVVGFAALPLVGDHLEEVASEREARNLSEARSRLAQTYRVLRTKRLDLEALTSQIQEAAGEEVRIVLKADNLGSLEALQNEIEKIKATRGRIVVIQAGVGNITESDVLAARDAHGPVIGFNVGLTLPAKKVADKEGVKVAIYNVIYQVTDDLSQLLLKSVKPERLEHLAGEGEVLKVFRTEPERKIIGIALKRGRAAPGYLGRFYDLGGQLVGDGEIISIQQLQKEMKEVAAPGEFGFLVKIGPKVKPRFRAEFIQVEEKAAELKQQRTDSV